MARILGEDNLGDVRICDARNYDMPAGWVIEQFGHWNQPEPSWAIPAWEERGYPDLAETFPNVDAAELALDNNEVRFVSIHVHFAA